MGTTYTVKYLPPDNQVETLIPEEIQIQQQLNILLADINRQMSTYDPESEISRFNRLNSGESLDISADFAHVLNEAVALHARTEGALDITIGPLVNVWGFGPDKSITHAPDAAALAAARQKVGLDKIRIEPQENGAKLSKLAEGVALDLSAIAKGFGVDKLAQHLDSLDVQHYLVEIGGELRGKGYNAQGAPWRVGIETPQAAQQGSSQIVITLQQQALATSGDYRNFRTDEAGQRVSHIIDPASGMPIRHRLASVSVVADTATTADGLATALFVLGEDKALALAEQHGWAVFVIVHNGDGFRTEMSSAFKQLIP
ncbi:thiamine biosynthesis lipoprotein [Neisseria sp. HSC-16F19]|nr:FAD:protein FMN transferase [Neisseria sp. HSC-16F19]MCP2040974.1 thiamine biosynthesis lipoprotein [Neisseria sp. HSC-16F19]